MPLSDYHGTNVVAHRIIEESKNEAVTPVLNLFSLSILSFHVPSKSETFISRPNLKKLIHIILLLINSQQRPSTSFKEESNEDVK